MNLVQTLLDINDLCASGSLVSIVVSVVKTIFTIIQFGVPAVLIILCAIDMFKAMTNGDEKEVSKAKKTCIHRLIYALVIFLIVPILRIIMTTVNSVIKVDEGVTAFEAFFACWDKTGTTGGTLGGGTSTSGVCRDYNNNIISNLSKDQCFGEYYWDNNG